MTHHHFDDFHPGDRFESPGLTVTEGEIIGFALKYDPQAYHLDREAAKATEFGGLIAPGMHTLSLSFALFFRLGIAGPSNIGALGFEEVRFLRPLRPGDTIRIVAEVLEARASQSKPDRGVIKMRHDTFNQNGELILSAVCLHRFARRPAAG